MRVFVCVCARARVRACACVRACVRACLLVCMCVRARTCKRIYMPQVPRDAPHMNTTHEKQYIL